MFLYSIRVDTSKSGSDCLDFVVMLFARFTNMGLSVDRVGRRVAVGRALVPAGQRRGDRLGERPGGQLIDHATTADRVPAHGNICQELGLPRHARIY